MDGSGGGAGDARRHEARLAAAIAGGALTIAAWRFSLALKAHFNPLQPRVPAGRRDGGQWTDGGSGGGSAFRPRRTPGSRPAPRERDVLRDLIRVGDRTPSRDAPPAQEREPLELYITRRARENTAPPDIPVPEDIRKSPTVPSIRPASNGVRLRLARTIAMWAFRVIRFGMPSAVSLVFDAIDVAHWLVEFYPYIRSYLDEPKSLQELRADANARRKGYDLHHIVEQSAARAAGFPESLIEGPENLVWVPTFKHWQVTQWFMLPNEGYGGLPPRNYLVGKNWAERRRVGIDALKTNGIIK